MVSRFSATKTYALEAVLDSAYVRAIAELLCRLLIRGCGVNRAMSDLEQHSRLPPGYLHRSITEVMAQG